MDRMIKEKCKAIALGFFGILVIVLGIKFIAHGVPANSQSIELNAGPALLFFNIDEPCQCMQKLVDSADSQINGWSEEDRSGIPVYRIDFEEQPELGGKYKVFRVPCLVLIDGDGQIVHRQDYPVTEGWPFKPDEFEKAITGLIADLP